MYSQLEGLIPDLANYRESLDRIFSDSIREPEDCRRYFFDLLISVSQLYLDYLLLTKESPFFVTVQAETAIQSRPKVDIQREAILRRQLRNQLESWPFWVHFEPKNAFSQDTGLYKLDDYIQKFCVHLPEIYEETFRLEEWTKNFLSNQIDSLLTDIIVGLQHIGRNHISFVQQALQWAADETSWK
jgi:hypothetical protein